MISLLNNDDTWNHTLLVVVVVVCETHMLPLFLHFQNFPVEFLGFQQFLQINL
jgi:hypothetical protein